MPLGTSLSAAKCISVEPVAARTSAMFSGESAPQPRMMMRFAGLVTSLASRLTPSTAVSRWPLVSTRPTLAADQRLKRFDRIAGHVEGAMAGDGEGAGGPTSLAHALFVDRAVSGKAPDHDAGDAEVAKCPTSASIERNSASL